MDVNQLILKRDIEKFRKLCYAINKVFDSLDVDDQSVFEVLSKHYQHRYDKAEAEELVGCLKANLNKYSSNRELQSDLKDFAAICTLWYTKTEQEFVEFRKAMGGKERSPIVVDGKKQEKKQEKPPKETKKTNSRIDFPNGNYYIGEIRNNVPHGRGKYYWTDGDWHEGYWLDGVQSGRGTFYSVAYRRTDTGTYKDGARYGKGRMAWEDGSWYEGDWNINGAHGKGVYYSAKDKRTDIGDFIDSNRDGTGIMKWANGDRYEGTWKDTDNGLEGTGVYYFADGSSESGRFVNGEWVKQVDIRFHYRKKERKSAQSNPLLWVRSHKLLTILFVLIILVVAGSIPKLFIKEPSVKEQVVPLPQKNYRVIAEVLNVRERPDMYSAKTGQIVYGDQVRVETYDVGNTGFAQINHQGTMRYVSNKYLQPIDSETMARTTTAVREKETPQALPAVSTAKNDINKQEEEEVPEVSTSYAATSDDEVHVRVEQMPSFPGGADALFQFIQQNLRYPVIAVENGIQGRVVLRFVVDKTGNISDITIVNSVDPACDREAIRVIQAMPKWTPGYQDGKPVNVSFMMPISFRLK